MVALVALTVLLISTHALAINEGDSANKTSIEEDFSTKTQERIHRYELSIKYWDTNKQDVGTRFRILTELADDTDELTLIDFPFCSRERYPMVCDSMGTFSENACLFRLKRLENPEVLPVLVFATTPIDEAMEMCEKEFSIRKP